MENLAFKIRRLRELRNYSQEYVAQQLGISIKTYQRLEAGKSAVSVSQCIFLAKMFGISFEQLQQFDPGTSPIEIKVDVNTKQLFALQEENAELKERLNMIRAEKLQLLKIIEYLMTDRR